MFATSIGREAFHMAPDSQKGAFFEFVIQAMAKRHCAPGSTVIDAGANGGGHTGVMAEAVGPNGRVVAFEPDRRIADTKLMPLQERYPQIIPRREALSDHAGTAVFHLDACTALSSLHVRPRQEVQILSEEAVDVTTLDLALDAYGISNLPFVKMDVEGAELDALRGAVKTLKTYGPLVITEIDWAHVFNINPERYARGEHETEANAFFDWLASIGYKALDFFGEPLRRYDPHAWNIVLMPASKDEAPLRTLLLNAGSAFFANPGWSLY